jgi:hypothetical protein
LESRARRKGPRFGRALISALLAPIIGMAVAACGGSSNTSSSTSATTTATTMSTTAQSTTSRTTSTATRTGTSLAAHYRELEGALSAYAACMRAHGVKLAPPHRNAGGVPVLGVPSNTGTRGPLFESGLRACRALALRALQLSG